MDAGLSALLLNPVIKRRITPRNTTVNVGARWRTAGPITSGTRVSGGSPTKRQGPFTVARSPNPSFDLTTDGLHSLLQRMDRRREMSPPKRVVYERRLSRKDGFTPSPQDDGNELTPEGLNINRTTPLDAHEEIEDEYYDDSTPVKDDLRSRLLHARSRSSLSNGASNAAQRSPRHMLPMQEGSEDFEESDASDRNAMPPPKTPPVLTKRSDRRSNNPLGLTYLPNQGASNERSLMSALAAMRNNEYEYDDNHKDERDHVKRPERVFSNETDVTSRTEQTDHTENGTVIEYGFSDDARSE